MPRQTTAPRILRLPEVLQITGMGKTFIYDRMRDGTFPKQIQLGSRTVVWKDLGVIFWEMDSIVTSEKTYRGGQKEGNFYMLPSQNKNPAVR